MKNKTKNIIKEVAKTLIYALGSICVMLTFVSFFLVFINSNTEHFQKLPYGFKIAIPVGFLAMIVKSLSIDWFGFYKK